MRGFSLQKLLILIKQIRRRLVSSKVVRQLRLQLKRIDASIFRVPKRYLIAHRHTRYTRLLNKLYAFRGAAVVVALVLVFHILSPALTPQMAFALNGDANLNGYIWENDDGSDPDSNTQIASGNGSITVPRGSRLNLRAQIKNTGDVMDLSKLGLFYDRGDGMWSRVRNSMVRSDVGDSLNETAQVIDGPFSGTGQHNDIAIDDNDEIWISYFSNSNTALKVAHYVGSGGNCVDAAWDCTTVDNTGTSVGQYTSIAIDSAGNPWVSYYNVTASTMRVAQYVGTGGNCTSTAWNCSTVYSGTSGGQYTSIAIDSTDAPWVSFYELGTTNLRVARYVGSGGSCSDTAWECTIVDNTSTTTGQYSAIAIDGSDTPWVSYYDLGQTAIKIATYVGTGGNCTSTAWNCEIVDTDQNTGQYTSIAFDRSGNAWLSYYKVTTQRLKYAQYVGSGGDCTSAAWNCAEVDAGYVGNSGVGQGTSIAFDNEGIAWISYQSSQYAGLKVARYDPSGGTCGTGWDCTTIELGTVGTWTSIDFDSQNMPYVVSHDNSSGALIIDTVSLANLNIGDFGCDFNNGLSCISQMDDTGSVGNYNSVVTDKAGRVWVSYFDATSTALRVMKQGISNAGGTGCSISNMDCSVVDNTGTSTGQFTAIALDANDDPWISYYDVTNTALKVAHFVGAGGSCTDTAWDCTTVDNVASVGQYTSIAIDASGNPWVSYYDASSTALRVATYVGGGTGNCTDNNWNCEIVDNTGTASGTYTDIAIDGSGTQWISYATATTADLKVARYVGTGGSCTSTAWSCSSVETSGLVGNYSSIAIDPAGNPWVAHYNQGATAPRIARYVGSGGSCPDTAWNCDVIDDGRFEAAAGEYAEIAMDPSGTPWVAYYSSSSTGIHIARYVGSGGNCSNTAWQCSTAFSVGTVGQIISMTFDINGRLVMSFYDATNTALGLIYASRLGEVQLVSSQRSSGTLSESHVDMTTTTDTTNRDDADCIGGGTWNDGVMSLGDFLASGTLPDGSGTAQCTEVIFTISLAQSAPTGTYRFMIASQEDISSGRSYWRGPVSIAGGSTPNLTVIDSSSMFSKDASIRLPDCADTDWGCSTIASTNDVGSFSGPSSLATDPQGATWTSYYDATNGDLIVAQYVGTGGSGCASSAWTCTAVDTTNDVGQYSSIAVDPNGNPWVSYYDTTGDNLRIAQYVGTGGSGCASSAWTCTAVDTTNDVGQYSSIAVDTYGTVWVSYYDATGGDLRLAKYLSGSTDGTGCAVNTWQCVSLQTTNDVGQYSSIAISPYSQQPMIAYYDATNGDLMAAMTTVGGTGCTVVYWSCVAVDSTNNVGQYASLTFSGSTAKISYYEAASGSCDDTPTTECSLRVASNSSSGCTATGWSCSIVDNPTGSGDLGRYSSIVSDVQGLVWVSYYDATNGDLKFGLNTTGTGCSSSAWDCTTIESTNDVGQYSSLAISTDGTPIVSYYNNTSDDQRFAKLHYSRFDPMHLTVTTGDSRRGYSGRLRHSPTLGQSSSATNGNCSSGTTDYYGLCGLYQNNGDYDTIVTQANESPLYLAEFKFAVTDELPTIQWVGKTNLAPNTAGSTGDIILQVFNTSTLTWETLATNSTSSDCSTDNCTLSGTPSTTSIYFFNDTISDESNWIYYRVYQIASASTGITFKTDQFSAFTTSQKMGTGSLFQDGVERPLNQR